MSSFELTKYKIDELVEVRKVALKPKQNTLQSHDPNIHELAIKVPLRRVDSRNVDLVLEFYARLTRKSPSGIPAVQNPSASLLWHGHRIRCLDRCLKHPVIEGGIKVGTIKGWHEHYWTDVDRDDAVREPNPPVKNFDLFAIIEWCTEKWNIEGIPEQIGLFHEP